MSRLRALWVLVLALCLAAGAHALVVRDSTNVTVGTVEGTDGRYPFILIPDGPRLVPLRVSKTSMITVESAFFLNDTCSGTPYVVANQNNQGLISMNGVYYTMKNKNQLYRTKPSNPIVLQNLESRFDKNGCADIGTLPRDAMQAQVLVRNLTADFPPPYRVQ